VARVSAVVPLYNRTALARETIDSVLAQTFEDLELIAVDDGSAEDVPTILGSLLACLRLVRRDHGGIAAARNTGLAASRGEMVAFLDSDDVWLPQKLERQVALLEANPHLAACFTNHSHWRDGAIVRERRVDARFAEDPLTALVSRPEVSTSSLLIRRDARARRGLRSVPPAGGGLADRLRRRAAGPLSHPRAQRG
jgi:glycosyltransferase involved in cell wall biosynthesis